MKTKRLFYGLLCILLNLSLFCFVGCNDEKIDTLKHNLTTPNKPSDYSQITGLINATEIDIASKVPGRVSKVHVLEGQREREVQVVERPVPSPVVARERAVHRRPGLAIRRICPLRPLPSATAMPPVPPSPAYQRRSAGPRCPTSQTRAFPPNERRISTEIYTF